MKTYNIIDQTDRDAKSELIRYTFEQLLEQFRPEYDPDYPEQSAEAVKRFNEVNSISDLNEYLAWEADGMRVNYEFTEDEDVERIEDVERWNRSIALAR